jgi:proteasome lid subunit RPN8/RPN11
MSSDCEKYGDAHQAGRVAAPPRRSSRPSRKPMALDPSGLNGSQKHGTDAACASLKGAGISGDASGLDQIALLELDSAGGLAVAYDVLLHPCAAALIQIHSHLAQTEIIGYLGGVVVNTRGCDGVSPDLASSGPRQKVFVLEAFPAKCVTARALAKTGRDAYSEVEMDPESDVEVRTRINGKGMSIVGWYHSHPYFSTDPSEVDVENQLNYQTLLFRGAPYIALICSPFWDDLPDAKAKLDMFYVQGDNLKPIRVSHVSSSALPPSDVRESDNFYARLCSGDSGGSVSRNMATRLLASLENEAMNLVSFYSSYARRTDLHRSWRGNVTFLEKLRNSLCSLSINDERHGEKTQEDLNASAGAPLTSSQAVYPLCGEYLPSTAIAAGDSNRQSHPDPFNGTSTTCDAPRQQEDEIGLVCVPVTDNEDVLAVDDLRAVAGGQSERHRSEIQCSAPHRCCEDNNLETSANSKLSLPDAKLNREAAHLKSYCTFCDGMPKIDELGAAEFMNNLFPLLNSIVSVAGETWTAVSKEQKEKRAQLSLQKRRRKRKSFG